MSTWIHPALSCLQSIYCGLYLTSISSESRLNDAHATPCPGQSITNNTHMAVSVLTGGTSKTPLAGLWKITISTSRWCPQVFNVPHCVFHWCKNCQRSLCPAPSYAIHLLPGVAWGMIPCTLYGDIPIYGYLQSKLRPCVIAQNGMYLEILSSAAPPCCSDHYLWPGARLRHILRLPRREWLGRLDLSIADLLGRINSLVGDLSSLLVDDLPP